MLGVRQRRWHRHSEYEKVIIWYQVLLCCLWLSCSSKIIQIHLQIYSWYIKVMWWQTQWDMRDRCFQKECTVYPKKYAHGFCFAVLCCGYTLADFPIPIRLTSLALWQSNDFPSASKETLMNMDKHFMWIHYERLHNHNTTKHNKTVCIFLGTYCTSRRPSR